MVVTLTLSTHSRTEIQDLTPMVEQALHQSGVKDGLCTVYVPHTTAGVIINENYDPNVKSDLLAVLATLVPVHGDYQHSEGNSDAHVKASLVGTSVALPINEGRLVLGTWQGILFCEFDGPRTRQVIVHIS
jgi:secondary thiamine-phosphate synthase enzyme